MNRFHQLKVKSLRTETPEAVSFALEIPPHLRPLFRFSPGQHVVICTQVDGEEIRRSYSICSGINDDELRVAIKRVPGGRFSNFANAHFYQGQTLSVMPPGGVFRLQPDSKHQHRYLAVAAGSGITPILSIIKSTLETEPLSQFTLLYGNRNRASMLFREDLEDLKNRFMHRLNLIWIFSREPQDIDLFNGRIDALKSEQFLTRWIEANRLDAAYLCGPQSMVTQMRERLIEHGMPTQRIHCELFRLENTNHHSSATTPAAVEASLTCHITVIRDGRALSFELSSNSQSLLEAGNAHGADLPYACKAGVCSTCKCKVIEGDVEMLNNQALEADEVTAGFVLSCQSYPRSPRVTLDFDQH